MDNRIIAAVMAIVVGSIVAAELVVPATPAPLVERDASACIAARFAPTDYNLERCYGEPF